MADGTAAPRRTAIAYGMLGMPLAFAALPLYVHVPAYYASEFGLSLAWVGMLLLLARLGDALIDPWLGQWSDRAARRRGGDRRGLVLVSLLPFALGMWLLLSPPHEAGATWLAGALALAYLGLSGATINYHAWGAALGVDGHQRAVVTAWREAWGLGGVLFAAAMPALAVWSGQNTGLALRDMAVMLLVVLVPSAEISMRLGHQPASLAVLPGGVPAGQASGDGVSLRAVVHDRQFRRLLGVVAASGLAAAVPSTLVVFFVRDVLVADRHLGVFLALYFVAAAASLPGWIALARHAGKVRAWAASMALATLSFVWAAGLGEGDVAAFGAICVLTGSALGAELALPPALLADLLARRGLTLAAGGAYFGLWNFVLKLNLALAAGLALPLVALAGYEPSSAGRPAATSLGALALTYAALPAVVKAIACGWLWRVRRELEGNPA